MKWIQTILRTFWRVWFYILMLMVIIILFPFLLVTTAREKWYPAFFKVAKIWGSTMLFGMGFTPKIIRKENFEKGKSYMLTANHTSMMDIMLMLYLSKNPFVFVGKKELAKMPIFGFFYKRTCILVDRKDPKSRKAVFDECQRRLNQGVSICIFPEGGIPDDTSIVLDEFKDGAFRLAIQHQIPVVPISFPDNKKHFSYSFFTGFPGKLTAIIHPFISTNGLELKDKRDLKEQTRSVILSKLKP
ncbi:MAG: lysophospholipid acyltransferase family protein [Bacteroidota bacterium]